MILFRDRAVVLRTQKLGEADRIITLLTREHGLRRAVARGVRKTNSRFGGRLEPFALAEVQLYEGRSLDTVKQVEAQRLYGPVLSADYERYTAANAICETAVQLTENEQQPVAAHFYLVAGALGALAAGHLPASLVLASYLLRALAVAGWAVQLDSCVSCQGEAAAVCFSCDLGGVLCETCSAAAASQAAGKGTALPTAASFAAAVDNGGDIFLTAAQLQLFSVLQRGAWQELERIPEGVQRAVVQLIEKYAQWHLERRLRSLTSF